MPAPKNLGAMITLNGRQVRVIARTTYADLMAMTGLTRDYVSQTSNKHEIAWLDRLPENTLFYFQNDLRRQERPLPVPDSRILHRSAKDKRATAAVVRAAAEERRAGWDERARVEAEAKETGRRERAARALYDLDRRNEEWDETGEEIR